MNVNNEEISNILCRIFYQVPVDLHKQSSLSLRSFTYNSPYNDYEKEMYLKVLKKVDLS